MRAAVASPPVTRTLAPAAVLFAILVAHSLLETARDALLLARLGPEHLALAYLVMAACAVLAVVLVRRWRHVRDPRRALVVFLVFATLGTSVLAATIALSHVLVFALYVWTGFIATLVVPSFWTAIDRSLRIAEAKRVFGAIGAGGVLGAMTGSALASVLARWLDAEALVPAGAIAFAGATLAARVLVPREVAGELAPRRARAEDRSHGARRYVGLLLAVGMISTVVLTLGDLTFKTVMANRLSADDLAPWFGAIYTLLNGIALVIQVVVTPRLLARWGIGTAIAVLPVILVATACGFALSGALIAVIALKLGDGGLRHSLHRVGSEILYLPVPSTVRDGGKLVADALGQRGGQAVAALLAGGLGLLGGGPRTMAVVTAVTGVVWLVAVGVARRAYTAQLLASLQAGEIQRDVAVPPLDSSSLDLLERSIASDDELEALAALDLLARRARIPARVLRDPRPAIVRHALSLLEGELSPEVAEVLGDLLDHRDPQVRAAALAASCMTGGARSRLATAASDDHAEVRAVALVHLVGDLEYSELVADGVGRLLAGTAADRIALADAIAFAPNERFRPVLRELLAAKEPAVVTAALRVLVHAPELADLDQLFTLLPDAAVRDDARRVLVAIGPNALDAAIVALDDPATPLAIRRHLPRTIMRFRSARGAAALASRLPHEGDTRTALKLLRALGRMRGEDPMLAIDPAPVREYLHRTLREAARYAVLDDELETSVYVRASHSLVGELLAEKRRTALERAFRALGILDPLAGWRSAYDAITSDDPTRRIAGRELIDVLAPADLRAGLLAVVDDLSPAQRRAHLGELAPPPHASSAEVVAALLADPSESLRSAVIRDLESQRGHDA